MTNSTEYEARQRSTSRPSPTSATRAAQSVIPSRYFRWKYKLEWLIALILLIPGLIMIGVLALFVRLTSRGPALYRQIRVGRNGRSFSMFKIRTMRIDAEADTGPVWAQPGDPRVTRLGGVLRKLHLDELPQLFNVLRGEMALIGPRPERPEFTQHLAQVIPHYLERLLVLPGITGLAQINLPPDEGVDCVRRKLVLDLQYISSASLSLDIRMFLCSAVRLVGVSGESAMWLFALKRTVPAFDPRANSTVQLEWPTSVSLASAEDDFDSVPPPVSEWSDLVETGNNGHSPSHHSNGHSTNGKHQNGAAHDLSDGTYTGSAVNGAVHHGASQNGSIPDSAVPSDDHEHSNGEKRSGKRASRIRG